MMAPQKCKIGETSPSKTYAPSDFHASASKLVDDDDGLCNQNQKLIGEMAGFLASLECSPGDDNSVATWKHDNYSSAGLENTHAAVKASVAHRSPSMEDVDDGGDYDDCSRGGSWHDAVEEKVGGDRGGGTVDGGEGRREPRNCRSLGPIDENEAGSHPEECEYFNDDSYRDLHQTSPGESGNGDEDSLVAMAQRMDAASVISDPSIITGPSEKFLALPSSKLTAGLKKLGRMGGGGGKKPIPPPPYPRKVAAPPPPPPPRRQENSNWTSDEGEPMDDDRRRSASSAKSFDDMDGLRRTLPNMGAETREVNGPSERGRRLSHWPSAADGIPTSGVMPAPAADPSETNALDEKIAAKRKHRKKHKHKRKSRSKGRKKKGDVNLEDSMRGIGFNTRVDEACPLRIHANHGPPGRRRKKKSAAASAAAQVAPSNLNDSMRGMGFNTRIHETTRQDGDQYNGGPMPGQPASERPAANEKAKEGTVWSENLGAVKGPILEESDRSGSNDGTANSNDSDAQTEIFYESCTDSDESDCSFTDEDDGSYDSDANTEVYYESTDESDFSSSDEEMEAVGTSVELAVQDLNNKRALVKVKNLFGRRG